MKLAYQIEQMRKRHQKRAFMAFAAGLAAAFAIIVALAPKAHAQWTGCGAGAGASFLMGEAAFAGPVGLGAQGEKAGLTVNCDYRMQAFVVGLEANYDWYFGDAHTLGAKDELSVIARLGVLTNAGNLLYVGPGWGRADVGAIKLNSWKVVLGDEFRIPNSPFYLDLRATYSRYDETDISPMLTGLRVDSLEAGMRLKVKFGPGAFGGKGDLFVADDGKAAKVCDPKMANCK